MVYVGALTFDAADPVRLAGFWAEVLQRPARPGTVLPEVMVIPRALGDTAMLFLPVPEAKTAKNRFHPDLHTDDLAGELDRVLALGAEEVQRHDGPAGRWVVLRDVEGNEFCLVQDE
ncbi:MAG TPA: VOC family protein [Jiangellales bacterium]|nr:VOC family protein [Jiangellales bacterium]